MTTEEIKNATLEAIYWWNRDEHYYHKYFSQLDKIYDNKLALDFFIQKIFEMFLREYAVRRNLKSGPNIMHLFIDELFKNDFFKNVERGNIEIIDSASGVLKGNEQSTDRNTKSLLSKVAFLINPNKFYLYDSLAKKSIWEINKGNNELKLSSLDKYTDFVKQTELLRESIAKEGLFQYSRDILAKFNNTFSYQFFSDPKHQKAFEMRIVDKYLWLYAQQSNNNRFDNSIYLDFHRM